MTRATILCVCASMVSMAQTTCTGVNFLTARTVNLQPSATSHIDVVRQADGSYTGFELANAVPHRLISTTPHFERKFGACLPHTFPAAPRSNGPAANPPGASSQSEAVEVLPSGNLLMAGLGNPGTYGPVAIVFDVFDPQHQLISENVFQSSTPGEAIFGLLLADVNGDGQPDLIAISETDIGHGFAAVGLWVFIGNGDGTFQSGQRQTLNGNPLLGTVSFAAGDLNGDGKLDLAVYLGSGSPIVLLGSGDGTFKQLTTPSTGPGFPGAIALADLNGDGKLDLVASLAGIGVALGNGDGTLQPFKTFDARSVNGSVAIGDVNGDGIPDIVTSFGTILFGDGKGGFPTRKDYWIDIGGSVMLADFDGDGKVDIIVGMGAPALYSTTTSSPSMTVLFGQGGGAFTAAPVSPLATGGTVLAAADFDGDEIPDLVTISSAAGLTVLKGDGSGGFTPQFEAPLANGTPGAIAVADFNRDGKPDIAVLQTIPAANSQVWLFLNQGGGRFAAPLNFSVANRDSTIAAADLNGDGIPDLITASVLAVSVSLGKGDGTFAAPISYPIPGGDSPALTVGDFNGDGKPDIVVGNGTAVELFSGKGDGTFAAGIPIISANPDVGMAVVAADFNGDGRLDLAVTYGITSYPSAGIEILLGNGDGTFQPPAVALATPAYNLVSADMNGDGVPDLVFGGDMNGQPGTFVLVGNGDGTFQGPVQVAASFLTPVVADFNRDGLPDIAGGPGLVTFFNLSEPPPPLIVVSAASFSLGPLAPNSYATAFGRGLAANPSVTVQDSAGATRAAQVYFASAEQVNFLVPAGTALGTATVTITGLLKSVSAQTSIAAIAPGLFAGIAVRVAPDGTQSVLPMPIDLTAPGQVYFIMFGTGFDAAATNSAGVTIQGLNVPVSYAGPQPTFAGLDQVNVLLPPSLAGTGAASVVLTVAGQQANTVYVSIR